MMKFDDVFSDETKKGRKIPTNEYMHQGKHPIIDQGQAQIVGYTDLEDGVFSDVPAIIFGDHTRIIKYVDIPFFLGADGVKVLRSKVEDSDYKYLFYCLDNAKIPNTGYNRHYKWLKELEFYIPALDEQRKIVAVLDKVSDLIAKRHQQLDKLDELVKSRFVEMFGIIDEMVPLSYYIISLSAGKSLAGEEDCPNKVLKTGAVTYDYFDPTQVKSLPFYYEPQKAHLVKTGDVIISRMNTAELVGAAAYVWKAPDSTYLPDRLWRAEIKNETTCPVFLWQLLIQSSTKEGIRRIASGTSGSMKNISKAGLLGIKVKKVDLLMQKQFAAFVEQIEKIKSAIRDSLEKLETLKKSLMQKYFG